MRGLNSVVKCRAVLDFLGVSSVGFCCLLKTRVREENFGFISNRFGNSWDFTSNYSSNEIGRMWVMWKKSRFVLTPGEEEDQFVSGSLTDLLSGDCVEVLCVYAFNNNVERRLLWRRMGEISSRWTRPNDVIGDFNAIRLHSETFGGSSVTGYIEEFDMVIREADLVEPSIQGN